MRVAMRGYVGPDKETDRLLAYMYIILMYMVLAGAPKSSITTEAGATRPQQAHRGSQGL